MSGESKSEATSIHGKWKQQESVDTAVHLGPGAYVDKGDDLEKMDNILGNGHRYGYLARWNARRLFLEAVLRVQPGSMSELLADNVLDMVLVPVPAEYPSGAMLQIPHERLLKEILFNRNDDLFGNSDWENFDPETHPGIMLLDEKARRIVERVGRFGIARAWGILSARSKGLQPSVKDFLGSLSVLSDDGDIFMFFVEDVAMDLVLFLDEWASRWNLRAGWLHMVAVTTVCDGADRRMRHESMPTSFVLPERLYLWHTDLLDTTFSESDITFQILQKWNPREESRGLARERILKIMESELDRIEGAVAAVSEPTPTKTKPIHFDWLARYQMNDESYQDIAKKPGPHLGGSLKRQSVTEAVLSTAELVGLEVRAPGRGGRRRVGSAK